MKLSLLAFILALINTQWSLVVGQYEYCFSKDTERLQTRHFADKTAYQIIKGAHMEKQYLVPSCEPQKIWILHRHGTRLPSKNVIQKVGRLDQLRDEIIKNYKVRQNKPAQNALCPTDLLSLQMWKWNNSILPDKAKFLCNQGYEDIKGTAKLYQKFYPDLLPKELNSKFFLFRHTDTQRATESFKAFAEGLFGTYNGAEGDTTPERDLLLRPYKHCKSWNNIDFDAPGTETFKFKTSEIWNNTLEDISFRLGFHFTLESSDVELMYDICRYEQAWNLDRTSVWCSAFRPEQISIFEYADDLFLNDKGGYGNEDNSRLSCHAVQDMLTHLNGKTQPNAIVSFTHTTSLLTFVTALGLYKDDISINADNFNEMAQRRWRTSNISPFAANFVAVKYQCNNDAINPEKVIFFLNQNAVDLPWCNVGLCNWSDVMKQYESFYQTGCDQYYCRDGAAIVSVSLVTILLSLVIYLIN